MQSVITALLALAEKHNLKPADIAEVRVALSKGVYDMHGTLAWDDKFKALLSMPYITSVVLHDRACWLEQFEPSRIADLSVDAFARDKVKVRTDMTVQGTATIVDIVTTSGATYTDNRPVAKGDAADPLSRAEIIGKLRTAARGVISDAAVNTIITTVGQLENVSNVRVLLDAVRAS